MKLFQSRGWGRDRKDPNVDSSDGGSASNQCKLKGFLLFRTIRKDQYLT